MRRYSIHLIRVLKGKRNCVCRMEKEKKMENRNFPRGPVAKTPRYQSRVSRFDPGPEN